MKNIIILDNRPYIRYRVKDLIEKNGMVVHEVSNSSQLYNKLSELKNKVDLLILEINLKDEDGIDIIKKLKRKNINIPFMVLTSLNTRDAFIKSVKEGAIDYFIKPFDDKIFYDRVVRHAEGDKTIQAIPDKNFEKEISFKDYLEEEIHKAEIGKYKLSIVMSIFFKSLKDVTLDIENDNLIMTDYIYNKIKNAAMDAGKFSKYGSRTFIGAYPMCNEIEVKDLSKEMIENFNKVKENDSIIRDYYFDNVYVTFPNEGKNKEELLDRLTEKMQENIKEKRKKANKNLN